MKKIFSKGILKALFIIPLFLSIRPRSYIAHDEGYYILQSRAILDSGNWLAPTSWGAPVFDRTIGAQWIIAGCQKLFGYTSWSSHLPSLIFGLVSLLLTYLLAKKFFGVSSIGCVRLAGTATTRFVCYFIPPSVAVCSFPL